MNEEMSDCDNNKRNISLGRFIWILINVSSKYPGFYVFYATFNNIPDILYRSVVIMKESGQNLYCKVLAFQFCIYVYK